MRRVPLRFRLTLTFALAMTLVVGAMGAIVYYRLGSAFLKTADQNLDSQATEAAQRARGARTLVDPDAGEGLTIAALVDSRGRVVRSTPVGLHPFVSPQVLVGSSTDAKLLQLQTIPGRKGEWRILVQRLAGTRPLTLVIARSVSAREEALHHVLGDFLLAGPILVLLAALAGYGLAAGALRPVDAMRRRADAISASTPEHRLPVPEGQDELTRLATTLNTMLDRLQDALAHERRFVADASHELRTPLALLRTELELALRRPRSAAELERAVRSAFEETERLSSLAEDLLILARSDEGGLPIRRADVSAFELLQRVADRFARRTDEEGQTLTVEPTDIQLDADPVRLEQALGNLVDNSLAHEARAVRLSARERNGVVELHVIDDGFPADFVDRAFDPFSRANEARSTVGTGLGLAIVDAIARAHGGTAGAANRAEGGADVWLALQARTEVHGSDPLRLERTSRPA